MKNSALIWQRTLQDLQFIRISFVESFRRCRFKFSGYFVRFHGCNRQLEELSRLSEKGVYLHEYLSCSWWETRKILNPDRRWITGNEYFISYEAITSSENIRPPDYAKGGGGNSMRQLFSSSTPIRTPVIMQGFQRHWPKYIDRRADPQTFRFLSRDYYSTGRPTRYRLLLQGQRYYKTRQAQSTCWVHGPQLFNSPRIKQIK